MSTHTTIISLSYIYTNKIVTMMISALHDKSFNAKAVANVHYIDEQTFPNARLVAHSSG